MHNNDRNLLGDNLFRLHLDYAINRHLDHPFHGYHLQREAGKDGAALNIVAPGCCCGLRFAPPWILRVRFVRFARAALQRARARR